jgi:hypothetical protein
MPTVPPPPPPIPNPGVPLIAPATTRARADLTALDHVFSVLTSTLRVGKKVNPYQLLRDNIPIDKTHDLFGLDENMLSNDIQIYSDVANCIPMTDTSGNDMYFRLTSLESRRILAVAMFWDDICIRTTGGRPPLTEWHTLTDVTLGETLRHAIAGKARFQSHLLHLLR